MCMIAILQCPPGTAEAPGDYNTPSLDEYNLSTASETFSDHQRARSFDPQMRSYDHHDLPQAADDSMQAMHRLVSRSASAIRRDAAPRCALPNSGRFGRSDAWELCMFACCECLERRVTNGPHLACRHREVGAKVSWLPSHCARH